MRTTAGVGTEARGEIPKVDSLGRRSWSLEQRQRIVAEALAPNASVAGVARRHGLNANLVFKWIQRARDGWPDRRQTPVVRSEPMRFIPIMVADENSGQQARPPVGTLGIDPIADAPARTPSRKPRHEAKGTGRRGVIEIGLPGWRTHQRRRRCRGGRLVLSVMKGL